ncbi:DNA-binding protein [Bacteroidia bacterium]|nr:DNA-binding protein [Bacteroidia bacterium]
MTNEEKVQYWIELSDEDLKTADVLFAGGRYLFVCFMCHLIIEKIFKACYTKLKEDTPPYKHKLDYLAQLSGFYQLLSERQQNFTDKLNVFNIEARYPEYKSKLAGSLTRPICAELLEQTKNLQKWIKETILLTK